MRLVDRATRGSVSVWLTLVLVLSISAPTSALATSIDGGSWPTARGSLQRSGVVSIAGPVAEPLVEIVSYPSSPVTEIIIDAEGNHYFGASDDRFYSVAPDGAVRWSRLTDGGLTPATIAADGTVYFGSRGPIDPTYGWYRGYLHAIQPDGTQKWRWTTAGGPWWYQDGSYGGVYPGEEIFGSPALAANGDIVVLDRGGYLYRLSPAGTLVWTTEHRYEHGASWHATVGLDGTIHLVTNTSGPGVYNFVAVNSDGSIRWRKTIPGINNHVCVGSDGTVFVTSSQSWPESGALYAFTPAGSLLWSQSYSTQLGAPTASLDGTTVYVAESYWSGSSLRAFDAADGAFKWASSGRGNPVVDSQGNVFSIATDRSRIRATASNGSFLWEVQNSTGENIRHISIGGGGSLYAVDFGGGVTSIRETPDTTPPVTTLSSTPASPDGDDGWFVAASTVTLSRDKPGTTYYSWVSSDGPWTTYSEPFEAPEGEETLYYYSVDSYENEETVRSQLFKVDTEAPTTPTLSGSATSTSTIDLSWTEATDIGSGISHYEVYDSNTDTLVTSTPDTSVSLSGLSPSTEYSYYVRAVDVAGNSSDPSNVVVVTTTGYVTFADANLEAAIRAELGIPEPDPITDDDMLRLTFLMASSRGIQDLAGLEYSVNLQTLYVSDNEISDLSPLAGLTALQNLHLHHNQINDVAPLEDMTALQTLYLSNNEISDLSPLVDMAGLERLGLGWNQISDLSPLTGLTNLQRLSLQVNRISYLAPLSDMTELVLLELHWNEISDVAPLGGLTKLRHLGLEVNQISHLTPLSDMTDLQLLTLGWNQISDLSPLAGLTNLERLDLPVNEISDISDMSNLTNLKRVRLDDNQISDVAPLANMTDLELLWLYWNEVSDLSPLAGLTQLQDLRLLGNEISDLAPLADMTELHTLGLSHNQITEISPLVTNAGITSGDTVWIHENYLDLTPGSQNMNDIQALLDRGVDLTYEPQKEPLSTTVTTNPSSPDGEEGWFITRPTITLNRNEPGTTYYSWVSSDGPWTTYSEPFEAPEGEETLYYYSVNSYENEETVRSQLFKVDTEAPTTPTLSGSATSTSTIDLSWTEATDVGSGVSHYEVYDSNTDTLVTSTPDTSVSLSGLSPSTEYPYYVRAVDVAGNSSGPSNVVVVTTSDSEIVTFADPNLEAAVRNALGIPEDDITKADMAELAELSATGREIEDLAGLEHAVNLQDLDLQYNNQISDLTPLSGLTNLRLLYLSRNQINDISALSNLTNLQRLRLHDNQIDDISILSNLTNLQTLNLERNQINDISALSNLTDLQHLLLSNNQISDISDLSDLTNLESLWLSGNQISNISALSGMTNLERLGLYDNQISDISPLSGLINLWQLTLGTNQIEDISPLSGLTKLTYLHLPHNHIESISDLSGLTGLQYLFLENNQISDASPLSGLTNLLSLNLSHNQITDISQLVANTGIASGDTVQVQENYLDLTPGSQNMNDIQALLDRGVSLTYEPQKTPDTTPPVTSPSSTPASPDGDNGWYITAPMVTLSRDKPGTTYYQFESTSTEGWETYTSPLTMPEGEHMLYYYSVDTSENEEAVKSQLFKVDLSAPTAPTLSLDDKTSTTASISWTESTDEVSGVSGYRVYRQDGPTPLATVPGTSTTLVDLSPSTSYTLLVRAVDLAGRESGASNAVSFATDAEEGAPVDPGENVSVTTPNGVTATFDNVTGSGTLGVTPQTSPHPDPAGFWIVRGSYFDITFDGTFSGSFYVTIPYSVTELKGANESNLKLFHWKNNGWRDITVSVDTNAKTITGRTDSFSGFGGGAPLGEQVTATPATSPWSLAVMVMVVLGLAYRFRSAGPLARVGQRK